MVRADGSLIVIDISWICTVGRVHVTNSDIIYSVVFRFATGVRASSDLAFFLDSRGVLKNLSASHEYKGVPDIW
eukprot:1308629-Karenia_brevis.AAC.1